MGNIHIAIVHEIPGRVRLRLSLPPKDVGRIIKSIQKHEGIETIDFTQVTRSFLVKYKPTLVSSIEITVRTAMALSLENNNTAVHIIKDGSGKPLRPLDYYAGFSLLLSALGRTRFFLPMPKNLEYHAAAATTVSVLSHAWKEVKEDGVYHPEVLSAIYLVSAIINGQVLKASVLTWIVTFGRHLMDTSEDVCIVQALEVQEVSKKSYIDTVVRTSPNSTKKPLRLFLSALGKSMGIEISGNTYSLLERIKRMSTEHGNVLEGLGQNTERVYIRINQ